MERLGVLSFALFVSGFGVDRALQYIRVSDFPAVRV